MQPPINGDIAESAEDRFARIYEQHFALLTSIAVHKFRIPDDAAETLAHEIFIDYLRKSENVPDLRAWLIGAICNASRIYWRMHARTSELEDFDRADPISMRILDSLPDQLAAREALGLLPPLQREILRLRYFEGWTITEIASHLGVKPKYTQKLMSRALRRAEQMYGAVGSVATVATVSAERTASPSPHALQSLLAQFVKAFEDVV